MNERCENMDEFCKIAKDCAKWIERASPPKVLFAGMTPIMRFSNPPAPHIEISFMEKGSIEDLKIGQEAFSLPEGWVSVHGIHLGNYSPPKAEPGRAWGVMIDASKAPGCMSYFRRRPVFSSAKAASPEDLVEAFVRLRRLCIRGGSALSGYSPSQAMFDPALEGLPEGSALKVKGALLNLFGVLLESSAGEGGPFAGRNEAVDRALRLIEAHYTDEDMTLEWLAAKVCLSHDHFGRVFKRCMRMSPMAYAQALRLREAAALLRNTGERIERIARMVGYGDALYFSRLFRREFKRSPREFRKG